MSWGFPWVSMGFLPDCHGITPDSPWDCPINSMDREMTKFSETMCVFQNRFPRDVEKMGNWNARDKFFLDTMVVPHVPKLLDFNLYTSRSSTACHLSEHDANMPKWIETWIWSELWNCDLDQKLSHPVVFPPAFPQKQRGYVSITHQQLKKQGGVYSSHLLLANKNLRGA